MSSNIDMQHLNLAGQVALATTGSIVTNTITQPLFTMKSRIMVGQPFSWRGLYNGFIAVTAVDIITFGMSYATNDRLNTAFQDYPQGDLLAAIAAGALPAPALAVGEGLAANRQVHALKYSQLLHRAFRPSGIVMTILREIPFITAVFYLQPKIAKNLSSSSEESPIRETGTQMTAGAAAGAMAGLVTTPVDLIKTRVQTHEQGISIARAVNEVVTKKGLRGLFQGGSARCLYLSAVTTCLSTVNYAAPSRFPSSLHKE